MTSQRLAKVIRDAGYASRRDAEKIILEGRVKVDGVIINTPALNVDRSNIVTIDGAVIRNEQQSTRLWLYYKPVGLVTTHRDPQNRPTVFENLPRKLPRVISVGRLDINSEGLLLLTNSGSLAREFELPSNKYLRIYKVRAFGYFDLEKIESVTRGVFIDKEYYKPEYIKLLNQGGKNSWFEVGLTEGKNREIRNIFAFLGMSINRLIRISYGEWKLGNMKPGDVVEV